VESDPFGESPRDEDEESNSESIASHEVELEEVGCELLDSVVSVDDVRGIHEIISKSGCGLSMNEGTNPSHKD
jgi:hypothetical protein